MRPAAQHLASLPAATWEQLEAVVRRFEQAWRDGSPLDDYLSAEPAVRRALLVELVHTDLEYRLKIGEPVRAESYLQRYPELAGPPRWGKSWSRPS